MTQIKLTYKVENTAKDTKIAPLTGEISGGFRRDKKKPNENIFVMAETISQCLGFLLAHVRSIDTLKQFKAKTTKFSINGIEMPQAFLFYDLIKAEVEFKKTLAMMGGLLSVCDDSLGDRWARENNGGSVKIGKAKLDDQDVASISAQVIKKERFLANLRSKASVGFVWSAKEIKALEDQKAYNKQMRIENKETKKISNK
jgi:hypothetical protein